MSILINWLLSSFVIYSVAYFLPGVHVANFKIAIVAALVLGIINAFLKPILVILTLPITILTLGLFTLVINAFMILLATKIVPGFRVDGFWWALIFSTVVSLVNSFFHQLEKAKP